MRHSDISLSRYLWVCESRRSTSYLAYWNRLDLTVRAVSIRRLSSASRARLRFIIGRSVMRRSRVPLQVFVGQVHVPSLNRETATSLLSTRQRLQAKLYGDQINPPLAFLDEHPVLRRSRRAILLRLFPRHGGWRRHLRVSLPSCR